jgi:hypothetical protein
MAEELLFSFSGGYYVDFGDARTGTKWLGGSFWILLLTSV